MKNQLGRAVGNVGEDIMIWLPSRAGLEYHSVSCCEEAVEMHMIIAQHATALLKTIKIIIKNSANVC